jgi:mono/diheme cytochrome c family protein
MQKYLVLSVSIALIALAFYSSPVKSTTRLKYDAVLVLDSVKWLAPDSANNLVNPIEVNEESLLDGKMIYNKNCRSCHGKLGDGTGSGGKELDTVPSDFTNPDFLKQTDGSMFWKISEGKGDMKTYKSKLSKEDIWLVVNYIKKLASNGK